VNGLLEKPACGEVMPLSFVASFLANGLVDCLLSGDGEKAVPAVDPVFCPGIIDWRKGFEDCCDCPVACCD